MSSHSETATRVPVREERNHSQKVKIAEGDTGDQDQKNRSQTLKKKTYLNHSGKGGTLGNATWCHMFKSTLTGSARVSFDDLSLESVDSYGYLKKAFLANYLKQKKCIKYPVEIHHIIQSEGESIKDFIQRVTIAFLKGEVAGFNQARKKALSAWKQQEARRKQNFDIKGDFKNQQRSERRHDKFTLLTKSPKEILALDKGKFKTPPPMTTHIEKRNNNNFCEFHGEVRHNTDECMHLKRQIEELIQAGRVVRQRITQRFSSSPKISYPPLGDESGTKGPMIIEAGIVGHFVHRIYADVGSTSEILYENCFSRLRPEVKNQMVPTTAPLIGFSGEIIWPMGQILLLVKIGDVEHSTSTWMNFLVVRSLSSYNKIIGKPEVRKIQAVSSTAHGMLKFPVPRGILTLRSSRIIPLECTMVFGHEEQPSLITQAVEEKVRVAIHPEYVEQIVTIGFTLTEEGRKELCGLLRCNLDMFAWKPTDMTGKVTLFFKALKKCTKKNDFQWTAEAEAAFKQIKKLIAELPTLTAPMEKEELIVYLAAAQEAVNAVFMTKRGKSKCQSTFTGQEHQYRQILADFIVECLEEDSLVMTTKVEEESLEPWTFFTDESSCMDGFEVVPRSENKKADTLRKIASTSFAHLTKQILLEELNQKSINKAKVLAVIEEEGDTWMTLIYNYLREETLLTEKKKARAVRRNSRGYTKEGSKQQSGKQEARQDSISIFYNSKVRNTRFNPGDLVYRSNEVSHAEDIEKLGPQWEGPYEVTKALGKGAYKLRDRNGKLLTRT
nr:hypothetical protein [Tanacetum cinerariifolium]